MNRFVVRRLVAAICTTGFVGLSAQALASGFQLWEQSGASVGNYHAGYAASAEDASTAWFNPAGITKFKNQQLVVGGASIHSSFKYKGDLIRRNYNPANGTVIATIPSYGITAQGGNSAIVPNFSYVAPINDNLGFGFSATVPFGLKTDFGRSTPLRYANTLTSVTVMDLSPSLAYQWQNFAVGFGVDLQKAWAEIESFVNSSANIAIDTQSRNKANGTAWGYHAGIMYNITDNDRIGLSFHSQVVHHLKGSSVLDGPIAAAANGNTGVLSTQIRSSAARANITLPAYTALSGFHKINDQWDVMGTVVYTQWNVFKNLVLQNVAGVTPSLTPVPYRSGVVTLPENFRNTWNLSVGADYHATDTIKLRGAVGYDETPVRNAYRNTILPDNDRYVIALGGHYQAWKTVGIDLGWTHLFMNRANINPPQVLKGAQGITLNGKATGGADVYGAQVTWDIC